MGYENVKVTVILTCYNRKEKTINCINRLCQNTAQVDFIIVDDNSNDGTTESLEQLKVVELLNGTGSLYWSGGMRRGIEKYLNRRHKSNYVMLVNDDVDFMPYVIDKMLELNDRNVQVLVGATCGSNGELTYGGMKLNKPRKKDIYHHVGIDGILDCDTFNCNCVLVPDEIVRKVGNFDSVYTHSLADIDYGFKIKQEGYDIISTSFYVGVCDTNEIVGTWKDRSLSRWERIKKKESIKGSPYKEWFYFLNKNFGLMTAIRYSITPYIKIIFRR